MSIDYCPYVSHYMQVTAYKPLTEIYYYCVEVTKLNTGTF